MNLLRKAATPEMVHGASLLVSSDDAVLTRCTITAPQLAFGAALRGSQHRDVPHTQSPPGAGAATGDKPTRGDLNDEQRPPSFHTGGGDRRVEVGAEFWWTARAVWKIPTAAKPAKSATTARTAARSQTRTQWNPHALVSHFHGPNGDELAPRVGRVDHDEPTSLP